MNANQSPGRTPLWMTIVIILAALPVFLFPTLLSICPPDYKAMVWVYPFYILAAAWLEWQCYPQRKALAWVMVALTLLSHAAIWVLATQPLTSY